MVSPPRLTRRRFLRACAAAAAVGGAYRAYGNDRPAELTLSAATVPDPDGHHPALRLKGDWLVIAISDGRHTGLGEVSHSGDDRACLARVRALFEAQVAGRRLTTDLPAELAAGPFATAADFVIATAISGLDQALHDLIAQRAGVPVWQLMTPKPAQSSVPAYLSTNRALRRREPADFVAVTRTAVALGVDAVKLTPFERVTRTGDQRAQAEEGFARLDAVRAAFPKLSLRVDCHERFEPEIAAALLPRFARYGLTWLEEPCPPGPALADLRLKGAMPLAIGELFFGSAPFVELLEARRADIVMPDPKHVGGFGPLVRVCRLAEKLGGQVSPHNPSGPIATCAAVHAAAVSRAVTSVELILTSDPARQPGRDWLERGSLRIPNVPGWGVSAAQLGARTGARFTPLSA